MDLQSWGALAPVIFILVYVLVTVLFVAGTIPSLAAGVLFGPIWGTLWVMFGATLGATSAFLIARHLARDKVESWAGEFKWFQKLSGEFEKNSFAVLLFVRLSPIFPFNAVNYVAGVLPVSTRNYVLSTLIGMAPGTFVYVYAGHTVGCAVLSGSFHFQGEVILALVLLSLLSLIPLIPSKKKS